jgi:GNAT superfamily N-acetyltransferase
MEIRRITQAEAVQAAGHLFDAAVRPGPAERFLAEERHHLLIAYVDGVPAGMVIGVEMTTPDKGTEMFLYELGVHEPFRGRGIGQALVRALASLARERGCYGMWVLTDSGNAAAQAVYTRAGGTPPDDVQQNQAMFSWNFAPAGSQALCRSQRRTRVRRVTGAIRVQDCQPEHHLARRADGRKGAPGSGPRPSGQAAHRAGRRRRPRIPRRTKAPKKTTTPMMSR